jgi:four helix bundle protein
MAFAFENLHVYQRALDFADQAANLTEEFPDRYASLADLLDKAAISIATNLAEGNGRRDKSSRRHYFGLARGFVQECVPLLELARRRELVKEETVNQLRDDLENLSRNLSALIKGLDKNDGPPMRGGRDNFRDRDDRDGPFPRDRATGGSAHDDSDDSLMDAPHTDMPPQEPSSDTH